MSKEIIATAAAPKAIGPYAQAVKAGDWVYCSGQIPLDAASGEMVGADVPAQTRKVLENLGAVLKAAGLDYKHVVKTTVYLQDMAAFAAMNEVYAEFFPAPSPARAAIQAANLPKGARVEIDAVAYAG